MQLVIADSNGVPIRSISDYSLDLQYGVKNNFVLEDVMNVVIPAHYQIFADGTPFGGIIDKRCPVRNEDGDFISYQGRTIQGVLQEKIIVPDIGNSHLIVSGDANDIIRDLLSRVGLLGFFCVPDTPSGIHISSYRFYRYIDVYTGLRMMLSGVGARLRFKCRTGGHEMSATSCDLYGSMESERVYFKLTNDTRPVNHLIGLGKGEGAARAVVHWYADSSGSVSQTQTLFGTDERAQTYQLTSEEDAALSTKTKNKLEELQGSSEAKLTLPRGIQLDIGDQVTMSSAAYGITAVAQVIDVTYKAKMGTSTTTYEFGVPDYPEDME